MSAPSRLTPLAVGISALLGAGFACAAPTTLPALSINADVEQEETSPRVKEVSTATRTSTPARYVPQAIDTVKTANVLDYGLTSSPTSPCQAPAFAGKEGDSLRRQST